MPPCFELLKAQVHPILVLREVDFVPHFDVSVLFPHVVLLEVQSQIPLYLQNLWLTCL